MVEQEGAEIESPKLSERELLNARLTELAAIATKPDDRGELAAFEWTARKLDTLEQALGTEYPGTLDRIKVLRTELAIWADYVCTQIAASVEERDSLKPPPPLSANPTGQQFQPDQHDVEAFRAAYAESYQSGDAARRGVARALGQVVTRQLLGRGLTEEDRDEQYVDELLFHDLPTALRELTPSSAANPEVQEESRPATIDASWTEEPSRIRPPAGPELQFRDEYHSLEQLPEGLRSITLTIADQPRQLEAFGGAQWFRFPRRNSESYITFYRDRTSGETFAMKLFNYQGYKRERFDRAIREIEGVQRDLDEHLEFGFSSESFWERRQGYSADTMLALLDQFITHYWLSERDRLRGPDHFLAPVQASGIVDITGDAVTITQPTSLDGIGRAALAGQTFPFVLTPYLPATAT